ncbi:uncharacterized protein LOC142221570 [Haematobia irritans]|uniref:uncharacterized protein LOC142221570 n=1 Tax=Haematobia irritans TaxID=7368 RepID=UPI003F4FBAB2
MQDGLIFADKFFNIKVRCFVMDAPAKSFVLGTKGHSGYYSCTRCTQKGQMLKHRLIFPTECECTLRTNDTFRNRLQPEHHLRQSVSPLETLNIDIVQQCSLDYMHVICLGVMRTLLNAWVKKKGEDYSLMSWKCETISKELCFNSNNVTKEFQRKPRSLRDLERWKATELRQFLLYTGPFILRNVLSSERYNHFLKLSLALRILLDCNDCRKNNKCAEKLLKSFVNEIPLLYESSFLTYNFHALLHIHEDAKRYGNLDEISAFKFENYLQTVKRQVRKGQNVAAQIYKRQVEKTMSQNNIFSVEDFQYTPSSNVTALQQVYVPQSDNIVRLLMELRTEVASLKTEVVDLKRELKEFKDGNKRQLIKLTEEVLETKLECRKHHGQNLIVDELNEAQKLPFNNKNDLNEFENLLQENEEKLKQFKELIAKTGGEGPAQFLRSSVRKVYSDELATLYSWKGTSTKPSAEKCFIITLIKNICHLKYKTTDREMNVILQKHFVHAKDRLTKRKRND